MNNDSSTPGCNFRDCGATPELWRARLREWRERYMVAQLRVIGAHLVSEDWSPTEIARALDDHRVVLAHGCAEAAATILRIRFGEAEAARPLDASLGDDATWDGHAIAE